MIAIVNYNAGNIASVQNALKRINVKSFVTSIPEEILKAHGVIFPGQGRAGLAIKELKKRKILNIIPKISTPFLGICLGMQLLADFSNEDNTLGLSIIRGECRKFPKPVKIPHIGWNKVKVTRDFSFFKKFDGDYFYFVHSYYFDSDNDYICGVTNYGIEFPSIVVKENFFAVQFHPEKSGDAGQEFLSEFCKLCS